MDYFTPAWHSGEIEDKDNAVYKKYQEHLALLLPHWPPDVQRLADCINLHDGLIREFSWNTDEATLHLRLRCGDLQVGYFDLDLHYSGVIFSLSELESMAALKSDKVGSALYDEVGEKAGRFGHSILFISQQRIEGRFRYYEITIQFKELHLTATPRENRFDTDEAAG